MKKKICFVVAEPRTAAMFLKEPIQALSTEYDVYLIANIKDEEQVDGLNLAGYKSLPIRRHVSLWHDFSSLAKMCWFLGRQRFDIVHSVTPKAGFTAALAGFLVRTPRRFHTYTGQVWATRKGLKRHFLKSFDKTISRLDTFVLVDGNSQRDYLIEKKVIKEKCSLVIGEGSICGVNTERFKPSLEVREEVRKELKIPESKIVFVFMGRLNREKGIYELLEAFNKLLAYCIGAYLLILGADEEGVMNNLDAYPRLKKNTNFLYYGRTPYPERILQAGDVFCLPSYREGFGSSVIEASCLGIPVICSDAYGVMDAMIDNETGLRCKVKDSDSLYRCMLRLYEDSGLRKKLGEKGRQRVLESFSASRVINGWKEFYEKQSGNVSKDS